MRGKPASVAIWLLVLIVTVVGMDLLFFPRLLARLMVNLWDSRVRGLLPPIHSTLSCPRWYGTTRPSVMSCRGIHLRAG